MKIGITGSRDGMNGLQKKFCQYVFEALNPAQVHQGDCVGADADAFKIARKLGIYTVCHPPEKHELRAYTICDETRSPKSYFARNRNIVNETDLLIGFPSKSSPKLGGTWYTIKYAWNKNLPLIWFSQKPEVIIYETVPDDWRKAIAKTIGDGTWKVLNTPGVLKGITV